MERFKSKRTNTGRVKTLALVFIVLCPFGCSSVSAQPKWEAALRERIVSVAESQLKVREDTGQNDGKEICKYLRVTGLPEGHPWCAAFTSWVFSEAGGTAPMSARVVDWFDSNVVYKREWRKQTIVPEKAMVVGLYYPNLGRYGHIGIVVHVPPGLIKNITTIEGNTNAAGSREGQGVYRKIRSWKNIAVMSDYCLTGNQFVKKYHEKIKEGM